MRTGGKGLSSRGIRGKLLRRLVPLVVAPVVLLGTIVFVGIIGLRSDVDDAFARTEAALSDRPQAEADAVQESLDEVDAALDRGRNRLSLALVLTLAGATVAGVIGVTLVSRRLVGPIRELAVAARRAADDDLPATVAAVEGLGPGQPPLRPTEIVMETGDELEDLASAVNTLQATAVDLAVGEAFIRRQRTALFLNLGRRNQNLVSKQLEHLDELEREETDPATLDGLLRLDHLATRMRRNAENLLVFAGLDSPRRWTDPVSIRDVIRAAAAEIKDYERVELSDIDDVDVRGDVASDVVHLVAELLENAANFSSPGTSIEVFGRWRGSSFSVSVVDHGIGMAPERLEEVNRRLSHPELFGDDSGTYLGLFVVGKLAARHGMTVRLIESPFEGTTAKITLPPSLLVTDASPSDDRSVGPVPPVSIRDRDPGRQRPLPVERTAPTAANRSGSSPPGPRGAPQPVQRLLDPPAPAEVTASGFRRRRPRTPPAPGPAQPPVSADALVQPPVSADALVQPPVSADALVQPPVSADAPAPAPIRPPAPHDDVTPSGFRRRTPQAAGDPAAPAGSIENGATHRTGTDETSDVESSARRAGRTFGGLQAGLRTGRADSAQSTDHDTEADGMGDGAATVDGTGGAGNDDTAVGERGGSDHRRGDSANEE